MQFPLPRNRTAPRKISLVIAGMCFAAVSGAHADTISLVAYLSGASAVPPNQGSAFGEGAFTYDGKTKRLDYFITYEGMPSAQVEIHGPAGPTQNASVLIPFPAPQSPLSGALILNSQEAHLLLAGELYVEVHAKGYAGGEIRGQIEQRSRTD